ncbi:MULTISPECIES: AraC family transcriptional regulator [Pseudomonas]|uniref:AraC family transcriptional regulator n=1 Tax=Pseudomonas azadiae TaxID=2843612 RepID=A0ABS6P683_9PSED|nr:MULTISPECIES: AraC family transcriptional regulator [Pseudomonas]MBV4455976.1 AraC family transcriptional regulator [Pseudomonas azadiae]NMF42019.1 AraC family transcriptional regulator [Pseudomonas sp. SWRI 103]
MTASTAPLFWRDPALPFIEARTIVDGRKVTYTRHAHEHFSIGAITAGRSYYHYGADRFQISAGTVVLMNPGDVHACNPIDNEPWSYHMLYLDTPWLTDLQHQLGFSTEQGYRPFGTPYTQDTVLYDGLLELYRILVDEQAEHLQKQSALVSYFTEVQQRLNPSDTPMREVNHKLERAAQYIREHCTQALKLEDICLAAGLSPSYLIRAFKQYYGLTPHAFLVNQRIQFARTQLRQGELIADVALAAGFADQAHFQRTFKQHVAATPGQYRERLTPSANNPHWPPATRPSNG